MCSHFPDLPYDEPRPGSGYAGALPVPTPPAPYEIAQRLAELRKNNRWKLWDVPEEYRCPIVGTCFHVEELRRLWREAVAAGQVPGAFWALMTDPKANARLRGQACQDVHMLSDQVAERPWRHIVGATTASKEAILLRIVCINLIKCFKMLAVLAVVSSRVRSPSP